MVLQCEIKWRFPLIWYIPATDFLNGFLAAFSRVLSSLSPTTESELISLWEPSWRTKSCLEISESSITKSLGKRSLRETSACMEETPRKAFHCGPFAYYDLESIAWIPSSCLVFCLCVVNAQLLFRLQYCSLATVTSCLSLTWVLIRIIPTDSVVQSAVHRFIMIVHLFHHNDLNVIFRFVE